MCANVHAQQRKEIDVEQCDDAMLLLYVRKTDQDLKTRTKECCRYEKIQYKSVRSLAPCQGLSDIFCIDKNQIYTAVKQHQAPADLWTRTYSKIELQVVYIRSCNRRCTLGGHLAPHVSSQHPDAQSTGWNRGVFLPHGKYAAVMIPKTKRMGSLLRHQQ